MLYYEYIDTVLVDEILLPRNINWSTNFRVFPFNEKMAPSWLKHIICFIWVHVDPNPCYCLLQAMLLIFGLKRCKKYKIISVVQLQLNYGVSDVKDIRNTIMGVNHGLCVFVTAVTVYFEKPYDWYICSSYGIKCFGEIYERFFIHIPFMIQQIFRM